MSTKQSAVALHSSNGHSVSAEPTLSQIFGSNVFSDREMKKRLPKNTYAALRKVMQGEAEPVSYTHLDVYKRQASSWGAISPTELLFFDPISKAMFRAANTAIF